MLVYNNHCVNNYCNLGLLCSVILFYIELQCSFLFFLYAIKKCVYNQGPMEDHRLVNGLPCINIRNK